MFEGVYVATATPFKGDGSFDEAAYIAHVARLVAAGVHGLVPCGTTGESPTLSAEEKLAMFAICKQAGEVKVIGGTGGYSTAASVAATQAAAETGVDGVLAVVPYYNKPPQRGLVAHFRAIADVGLPVMIYNIPGRSAVNMAPETIAEAAEHPNIVAVKEASGTVGATAEIKRLAPELDILSGDDALFLPCMSVGAKGVVSVAANVDPARMVALWDAWSGGDAEQAADMNQILWPLYRALFVETNPIPVKAALHLLGHYEPVLRLPMVAAAETTVAHMAVVLRELGLMDMEK